MGLEQLLELIDERVRGSYQRQVGVTPRGVGKGHRHDLKYSVDNIRDHSDCCRANTGKAMTTSSPQLPNVLAERESLSSRKPLAEVAQEI